jgi:hypothetical protein
MNTAIKFNVLITSIWGSHPIRKTPYSSQDRAIYALKQRILLTDLGEKYNTGKIMFDLITIEGDKQIAKQCINLKFN